MTARRQLHYDNGNHGCRGPLIGWDTLPHLQVLGHRGANPHPIADVGRDERQLGRRIAGVRRERVCPRQLINGAGDQLQASKSETPRVVPRAVPLEWCP
jgi:hypothetical protein